MLTSRSFERHVSHLFISHAVLYYTTKEYMEYILTNLDKCTVAFLRGGENSATWEIVTQACSCPSLFIDDPFIDDGIDPAHADDMYLCTECIADEWLGQRGGNHYTTPPPASLREGLVRAFGPKSLLKLYVSLVRHLEKIRSTLRQSAYQARWQSYEAAFEIESLGDYELRLGGTARKVSAVLAKHGPYRSGNFRCTYDPFNETWVCYDADEYDESDNGNESDHSYWSEHEDEDDDDDEAEDEAEAEDEDEDEDDYEDDDAVHLAGRGLNPTLSPLETLALLCPSKVDAAMLEQLPPLIQQAFQDQRKLLLAEWSHDKLVPPSPEVLRVRDQYRCHTVSFLFEQDHEEDTVALFVDIWQDWLHKRREVFHSLHPLEKD